MSDATDAETVEAILGDPFHAGLREHGEFTGFDRDRRRDKGGPTNAMSDEEVEEAKARLDRIFSRRSLLLVLTYLGILGLMAKAYA